jgi:hypothetical protein
MEAMDRREHPRKSAHDTLYLLWDEDGVHRQARARLVDLSPAGLAFRTFARLAPGAIVYCASPAHAICSRAIVSHATRSLFTTTAGARFLLSF